MRSAVAPIALDQRAEAAFGVCCLADRKIEQRQRPKIRAFVRRQPCRFGKLDSRPIRFPGLGEREAEIVPDLGVGGCQLRRRSKRCDGFVNASDTEEKHTKLEVSLGVAGSASSADAWSRMALALSPRAAAERAC